MASGMRDGKFDIHHAPRKLESAVRFLEKHPGICYGNKQKIFEFLAWLGANGLGILRQVFYIQHLTFIAAMLGKPFNKCGKQDIITLMNTVNAKSWSGWTKRGYAITVKKFWRWLKDSGEDREPPEVKWIRIKNIKESSYLPEDLLTAEDLLALLKAAEHPRDKALVLVLYECAGRIIEILTLTVGRVVFDENGAIIKLQGGKGERRVRLIASAPALATWINHHPFKEDPNAPLWVNVGNTNHNKPLDYAAARKLLRELGWKAGVKKRVNPYTFRHSTITNMANMFAEAQMCEYFGWRQGSKMPQVYVHLSGRNIDDRLLELHGLKPKRENGIKLKVQICPRCQAKNTPANKFCSRCSSALDLKTALQVDQRIEKAEEVMETLLRDPQVKALLAEKIRELGLAEKLT